MAEIVTAVVVLTVEVVTANVALLLPAGTVTVSGTVATTVLLLVNVTGVPPGGAAADSATTPDDAFPLGSEFGVSVSPLNTGAGPGIHWMSGSIMELRSAPGVLRSK